MYNCPPSGKTVTGAKPVVNLKDISIQGMTEQEQIMIKILSCCMGLGFGHCRVG